MDKKIIIVTGVSGDIGSKICESLLEKKHIVIGCSRSEKNIQNDNYFFENCDITNISSIEKVVKKIIDRFGRIDVLINCAGIIKFSKFSNISEEEFNDLFSVNVKGPLFFSQMVLPIMASQKMGYIINIGSTRSISGAPNKALYSATKFALRSLTQSIYAEYSECGIKTTIICPGLVKTLKNMPSLQENKIKDCDVVQIKDITDTINYLLCLSNGAYVREIILGGVI